MINKEKLDEIVENIFTEFELQDIGSVDYNILIDELFNRLKKYDK